MTKEDKIIEPDSILQNKKTDFSRMTLLSQQLKRAKHEPEADFINELTAIFGPERYFRHQAISSCYPYSLGGIVEHLVVAENSGELVDAVRAALKVAKPYIVVGALTGSLFSEIGFASLVIVNRSNNISFSLNKSEIQVDAGRSNAELANLTAGRGLSGLEFLAGIPGTVGGAIVTNASLEGKSLVPLIKGLVVFMPDSNGGRIITLSPDDGTFNGSLDELFKDSENSAIILSVYLGLSQIDQTEILRRLAAVRHHHSNTRLIGKALGYCFSESLETFNLPLQEAKSITLAKNVSINWNTPDLLFYRSNKGVQPTELRDSIENIHQFLIRLGLDTKIRLRFLGYWPRKEDSGSSTDTESISL